MTRNVAKKKNIFLAYVYLGMVYILCRFTFIVEKYMGGNSLILSISILNVRMQTLRWIHKHSTHNDASKDEISLYHICGEDRGWYIFVYRPYDT